MSMNVSAATPSREWKSVSKIYDESPPQGSPLWFKNALKMPRMEGFVDMDDGRKVEFLRWAGPDGKVDPAKQGLVLVHGMAAHARWYAGIGPLLCEKYDVIAISNCGNGGSSFCETYSPESYAEEIVACAREMGLLDRTLKPVIACHSFGVPVGLVTVNTFSNSFDGLILCDNMFNSLSLDEAATQREAMVEFRKKSVAYKKRDQWPMFSFEVAPKDKFSLDPPQEEVQPWLVEYIANTSAVRESNGWHWCGDPDRFRKLQLGTKPYGTLSYVEEAKSKMPVAVLFGENSQFFTSYTMPWSTSVETAKKLEALVPLVILPNAGHHLLLDQPIAFSCSIDAMISSWRVPVVNQHHQSRL